MKHIKLFEQFIDEATISWSKMMKGVKSGDTGPWTIVAVENKKVIAQDTDIKTKEALPAHYEAMRKEHPKAKIHIEDAGGMVVFNESEEIDEMTKAQKERYDRTQKAMAYAKELKDRREKERRDKERTKAAQRYQSKK